MAVQRSHAWRCMYARATCVRAHPPLLTLRSLDHARMIIANFVIFGARVRPLDSPLSLADLSELSPDTEAINSPASRLLLIL